VIAALPFTTSHAEWIGLVVGVVSLIGIGGIVSSLICHQSGCFRRGRFRHGHYRLCHVHHPHVPSDGKITAEQIAAVRLPSEAAHTDTAAHIGAMASARANATSSNG
jgi:hypothetical protein